MTGVTYNTTRDRYGVRRPPKAKGHPIAWGPEKARGVPDFILPDASPPMPWLPNGPGALPPYIVDPGPIPRPIYLPVGGDFGGPTRYLIEEALKQNRALLIRGAIEFFGYAITPMTYEPLVYGWDQVGESLATVIGQVPQASPIAAENFGYAMVLGSIDLEVGTAWGQWEVAGGQASAYYGASWPYGAPAGDPYYIGLSTLPVVPQKVGITSAPGVTYDLYADYFTQYRSAGFYYVYATDPFQVTTPVTELPVLRALPISTGGVGSIIDLDVPQPSRCPMVGLDVTFRNGHIRIRNATRFGRPGSGTRERKGQMYPENLRGLMHYIGLFGETADALVVLYHASNGPRSQPTPQDLFMWLFWEGHIVELDLWEAVQGLFWNHIEDAVIGFFGSLPQRSGLYKKPWWCRPVGVGTGPAT